MRWHSLIPNTLFILRRTVWKAYHLALERDILTWNAGTGTQVGDKLESAAIAKVFCSDRSDQSVLYMGSVKTNIGHSESAAGLAGVIKSILVLKNGKIPPNLNFAKANEHLRLKDWNVQVSLATSNQGKLLI